MDPRRSALQRGRKCSSRPGSPVRTICCAGSSDKNGEESDAAPGEDPKYGDDGAGAHRLMFMAGQGLASPAGC
jgi:hypothetical protein